jgi:PilZ domain
MSFQHVGFVKTDNETYPCRFSDMSRTGATIIFEGPIDLPDRFSIQLTSDGKVSRDCVVQWHEGIKIGVSFVR